MAIWCSRDAISITKIDICIYCIYKNQIYNSKIWSKGTQIHKQYTKMKSHTHPSGSNPHTCKGIHSQQRSLCTQVKP